jgi:hypothetical protein
VLALALAALVAAGCANPHSGQLLLADVPDAQSQGQPTDLAIYAVDPGRTEPDESTRLTERALSPLDITTTAHHGQVWINSLGREWKDGVLLAYGDGESNVVTAGEPGGEQETLARSTRARTTVLRRGAWLQSAERCSLATSAEDVEEIGQGNCAISLDERWVASWPVDGQGLTVTDLRSGDRQELPELQVTNAGALSTEGRVLAVTRTADGFQGVVVDAASGDEVGRTETYQFLDVAQIGEDASGFVLQAGSAEGSQLLYVDTDAEVSVIDEGFYLIPVTNGGEVSYLRYDQELTGSSVRRWSPGDDEPEELLTGYVGAGSPDGEHLLVTRETPEGTEFWREDHGSKELSQVLVLERAGDDADPNAGSGAGIGISEMHVQGSMVHLQVNGATSSSYVRIDTKGDHSDVPVQGQSVLFESLDVDGTALLTRSVGTDVEPREEILVVRESDHEPDVRTSVGRTATNLIHEGTIYLTDTTDPTQVKVLSLRATGKDDGVTTLYTGKQIAGATWPQWGDATQSVFITPRLLLEQAQQAQQSNAAAAPTAQP